MLMDCSSKNRNKMGLLVVSFFSSPFYLARRKSGKIFKPLMLIRCLSCETGATFVSRVASFFILTPAISKFSKRRPPAAYSQQSAYLFIEAPVTGKKTIRPQGERRQIYKPLFSGKAKAHAASRKTIFQRT